MKSNLSKRINIGKDTESKLIQVGIHSIEELESIGAEQAFIRLKTVDPGACLSLLYGLQGAVDRIKWNELPDEKKLELQEFYRMTKKQC
jgi:DNA transformation protein